MSKMLRAATSNASVLVRPCACTGPLGRKTADSGRKQTIPT